MYSKRKVIFSTDNFLYKNNERETQSCKPSYKRALQSLKGKHHGMFIIPLKLSLSCLFVSIQGMQMIKQFVPPDFQADACVNLLPEVEVFGVDTSFRKQYSIIRRKERVF